jgi:sorbitol/mannitol transport system permease protein
MDRDCGTCKAASQEDDERHEPPDGASAPRGGGWGGPDVATQQTQTLGKILVSPAVVLLLFISLVPLAATIYFSFLNYNLLDPSLVSWAGFDNYTYFLTDPAFIHALVNTLIIVVSVLVITTGLGVLVALLMDQAIVGLNLVRLLVIAPFFIMPTVSALVWKNLMMHPVSGFFAWIATSLGLPPIDWFTDYPLAAIILIIAWQWLPFASLILLTALQSLDGEQKEAAEMDGAGAVSTFFYITLPHLARPITVVILIETIFLLTVFAEIYVTTGGGERTNNLAFLIYSAALKQYDIGAASAGGLVAVVLANIVAFFLVRLVGKNLDA